MPVLVCPFFIEQKTGILDWEMGMSEKWTIATAQKALNSGEVSAVDLVGEALGEIERQDGEGSRTFIRVFKNSAISQAATSDALRKMQVPQGPLAGIPISVKDLFDIETEPTSAGSLYLAQNVQPAQKDAIVIARLRAAGAVFLGHTNMTEFAFSGLGINPHFGTPKNAWNRHIGHVPGGSSSGAAISVAEGMAIAALGTDTGGSVRIPAAFNNLYGFKPSLGRHPMQGVFPLAKTLDTVGPIARSMACCRVLDHIMAGLPIPQADIHPMAGLRFAILETLALDDLDIEVAGAFVRALEVIAKAGARLERIEIKAINNASKIGALGSLVAPQAYHAHRACLEAVGDAIDPRVRQRMEAAKDISAADYIEIIRLQKEMQEKTADAFRYFDAILMPTVVIRPPEIRLLQQSDDLYREMNAKALRNTTICNLLGMPAASIPIAPSRNAPPVGMMIMGPYGSDAQTMDMAESVDACLKDAIRN